MTDANLELRRRSDPIFTRMDDDLLGLNTAEGLVYTLNRTGARIWTLLEDWTTQAALVTQLREDYDVEEAQCAASVDRLVAQLSDAGLLDTRNRRLT